MLNEKLLGILLPYWSCLIAVIFDLTGNFVKNNLSKTNKQAHKKPATKTLDWSCLDIVANKEKDAYSVIAYATSLVLNY